MSSIGSNTEEFRVEKLKEGGRMNSKQEVKNDQERLDINHRTKEK